MQQKPLTPRPPINIKLLAVRYILTVITFATLYSTIGYGLILLGVSPKIAGFIGMAAGVIGIFALIKKLGPWLDDKFAKKPDERNKLT